ncbi:hypothetical protein QF035_002082 [Streptomyces umbrinus]|uniref:Uncharacterized protein n=1 Tax=Streptomyces umbrinus TaxID=67370 RepID=A0ABU0SLQ5_9ACTN|nr:hypothetical protein [Streptomyces umbrinus]MDQ1024500.1 hypothetical protein [Streptomyces umbrinus]
MARRGGCLINGCLGALVLALVLVVGAMVSFWNTGREAGAEARDHVTASAEGARDRLAEAAADGELLDTEIQRAVLNIGKTGEAIERRDGRVTVTARFTGMVNVGFGGTQAQGCYRFEINAAATPPPVSVRELADKACWFRSGRPYREPAAVAQDVTAELRTAVAEGGPEGARSAEVWKTQGIEVEDTEIRDGQLVALVWLSGGTGPQGEDCYEFRAKAEPGAVDAKKLKPDGCYRLQRGRDALAEKARRVELDASAQKIERRLENAMADGRLTDTELPRALSLPTTDDTSGESVTGPVVAPESVERSSTEVLVVARVVTASAMWCYEFRARLPTASVTRRYLSNGCPF